MKRIYLAITKENENGGKCAYTESFTTNENLLAVMERIPKEAIDVTVCEKWRAEELVRTWNDQYKAQGVLEWF